MKRKGYIYERMQTWEAVKQAELIAVKGKSRNKGIRMHMRDWMKNLAEIHESVISGTMQTAKYKHMKLVSGQGKVRDISKLDFHPSHIQHQMLVLATQQQIDRSLIHDTFACRIGMGQHACAERLNQWVQETHKEGSKYKQGGRDAPDNNWYLQIDVCKYYQSIPHKLIRAELEHRYKDKRYIDAFMEPVEKFAPEGVGIPLGIRPSQIFGNLALSSLDRLVKEQMRIKHYCRYLDDAVLLLPTKADCWRAYNAIKAHVEQLGFRLHEPKVHRMTHGIDYMGYVTYPGKGMFIRTSNVRKWLKTRNKVTNTKRKEEIDSAFWGLISHANKHSHNLYTMNEGIAFTSLGIQRAESKDKHGNAIIDAPSISMAVVVGREVVIKQVVENIETKHGPGRMAIRIDFGGQDAKLIVNANNIKTFLNQCWQKGVTKMVAGFTENKGKCYDMDYSKTRIIEVYGREVMIKDGRAVYADNPTEEVIMKK